MREPPDRLTERVLQMLADARTSSMSRDEVMERLTLSLRRNLRYFARKKQHTPYVEAWAGDLEAIARAIALLDTLPPDGITWNLGHAQNLPTKMVATSSSTEQVSALAGTTSNGPLARRRDTDADAYRDPDPLEEVPEATEDES